jgi:hypothetical protein
MHSQLTVILAEQHIADLHGAAGHDRLVHAATTAGGSHAATASDCEAAAPVSFVRRLRRARRPAR